MRVHIGGPALCTHTKLILMGGGQWPIAFNCEIWSTVYLSEIFPTLNLPSSKCNLAQKQNLGLLPLHTLHQKLDRCRITMLLCNDSWPFFQLPTVVEFLWSSFQFAHGLFFIVCSFHFLEETKQKGVPIYFTYFITCNLCRLGLLQLPSPHFPNFQEKRKENKTNTWKEPKKKTSKP
jgi:hypothetical protein